MRKLVFTPEFEKKYDLLTSYLDQNFGIKTRRKVIKKINDRLRMLKNYPDSGVPLSELFDIDTDYRFFFISHNYIFYRYDDDVIELVKMYGEHEDYMLQMFGISSRREESIEYWGE